MDIIEGAEFEFITGAGEVKRYVVVDDDERREALDARHHLNEGGRIAKIPDFDHMKVLRRVDPSGGGYAFATTRWLKEGLVGHHRGHWRPAVAA